ncbi:TPA: DUF4435 domain-containing protein [Vibrio cholerae]|nr:DUF4435 domain-containing protein [Vibrio cholerae]
MTMIFTCTPCYSIENLYAQVEVFRKILVDEFSLCDFRDDDLIQKLCLEYKKFEIKADESLLDLNSWLWVRKEQSDNDSSIKLNVSNLNLNKVLKFNDSDSMQNYTIESLDEIFEINVSIDVDRFNSVRHHLSEKDLSMVSRGKFRIECFRFFINNLVDDARKREGYFSHKKVNPRITLSKMQILSELTQYAVTPECLSQFLCRHKETLVA